MGGWEGGGSECEKDEGCPEPPNTDNTHIHSGFSRGPRRTHQVSEYKGRSGGKEGGREEGVSAE